MIGSVTSTLLLTLLAAQAPADVRVLPIRAAGLEKGTLDAARGRVLDEIKLMGLTLEEVSDTPDPACFDDASCVGPLSGDTAGVLDVEMVRFGPDLIITSRFFDRTGELKASTERTVTSEGFQMSGTLLGPDFATAIREAVDAAPDPLLNVTPSAQDSGTATDDGASTSGDGVTGGGDEGGPPIAAISVAGVGAGIAVFGAIITAAGVGTTAYALSVLFNSSSLGGEKSSMEPVRLLGVAMTAAGFLVLLAGVGVVGGGGAVMVLAE